MLRATARGLRAWSFAVAACLLALATGQRAAAGAPATLALASQPPSDFSDLLRPQETLVDVYFGGTRVGVARATYQPGRLRFDDPAAVAALLPHLLRPAELIAALTGDLPTHADLVCHDGLPAGCGELTPDVAGLIFDESRFQVEVFVNPKVLAVNPAKGPKYLPEPTAGLSLVDSLGGAASGSSSGGSSFSFQNRAIVAYRDARLTSEISASTDIGFQVETLGMSVDRPGVRYQAGLFWTPAFDFTGQSRVYGVGFGSQLDSRADTEQIAGAPLVVFLPHRSQVDILRDGRLLSSRFYDAGNQTLDTAYLPQGAYNVTLRIREIDGTTQEMQRFFVKSQAMPPADAPGFFVEVGALAADTEAGLPSAGSQLLVEAGYARRLGPQTAVDVNTLLLGRTVLGEVGVTHFDKLISLHAAALGSSDGNYGLLFDGAVTGFSNLVLSANVRKTWGPGLAALGGPGADTFSPVTQTNLLNGDSLEATGNVTYVYRGAQLNFTATYFKSRDSRSYAYGPSLTVPVWQGAGAVATLGLSLSKTNDGFQALASVRLQLYRGGRAVVADAGLAAEDSPATGRRSGAVGSITATDVLPDVLASDLTLTGVASHSLDQSVVGGGVELRGAHGDYLAQAEEDFGGPQGASTRYAGNFATSVAVGSGGVAFGGADVSASGIIVRLEGASPDVVVDVLVDGAPLARLRANQSMPIFLPPYRVYHVTVLPVGGPAIDFDDRDRRISLFPGNVQTVTWRVTPVMAVFARALDAGGRPIAEAAIEGAREPAATDDQGYFQVEVGAGATLTLHATGGPCRIPLPQATPQNGYAGLGNLVCANARAAP
jgi:hypothetical protein